MTLDSYVCWSRTVRDIVWAPPRWDANVDDRESSAETLERGSPVAGSSAVAPEDQRRAPHEGEAGDAINYFVVDDVPGRYDRVSFVFCRRYGER